MHPELLTALRKLHINTGHATNEDMRRCIRLAGGSELAQDAVKHLRCSTCARLARPKLQRPSRLPREAAEFHGQVCLGLFDVKDSAGHRFWMMAILDQFTSYTTVVLVKEHHSEKLWKAYFKGWLS